MEELDEDLAVAQTQVNLTCPLTQVDHFSLLMSLTLQHFIARRAAVFNI